MTDWTRHDLEQYVDGELAAGRADALTEALRRDHELRARLTEVTRLDDSARRALIKPVEPMRRPAPIRMGALAAATLLVLCGLVWVLVPTPTSDPAPDIVAVATPSSRPPSEGALRLIASIPVAPRPTQDVVTEPEPEPEVVVEAPPPAPTVTAGLDDALARGAVGEALRLLVEADDDERAFAYRRIATLIHSARSAEQVLDMLPPAQQLEVCRLWADDPQLRPVIFGRLRLLAADETIADRHAVVIERLAEDAQLDAWLRSYDLIDARRRAG